VLHLPMGPFFPLFFLFFSDLVSEYQQYQEATVDEEEGEGVGEYAEGELDGGVA